MKIDPKFQGIGMTSLRTRKRMVARLAEQGIDNKAVLEVMTQVPRHLFLDEALAHKAYEDDALPIGFQQTLSRPYTVARMTQLIVDSGPLDRVLEIGTGSGYQTAVLSRFAKTIYSMERIKALQEKARKRINMLRINNVFFRCGDGGEGWEENAPFDAIIAAAAPEKIPQNLLEQLAIGGRLIIPIGQQSKQKLVLVERSEEGYRQTEIEPAAFVPFKSGVEK